MTREIVIRIPEERAREMLKALQYVPLATRYAYGSEGYMAVADLRDLLQRAVDEAAADRLRRERD
jgi:hypothetical protein